MRMWQHEQLGNLIFFDQPHGLFHSCDHSFDSGLFDCAIGLEILHQSNSAFRAGLRFRTGARRRIDDEHVNGIGANVKHAKTSDMRM